MKNIKKDFIIKEVRSLALYMVLFTALLAYIIFYIRISPLAFLIVPAIILIFMIRLLGQASSAFNNISGQHSESWAQQVEREYNAAHPIYKVAYGEVHLLKTCVICRNKRKLIFIPPEQIIKIEERVRLVGVKRIPLLRFSMDNGKDLELDFSVKRPEDGEEVILWFIKKLGEDKVERSNTAVLR